MTKKLMLLIVLFVSVISVVLIAVWGTLPESGNAISVESISFNDYELNDSNDKIINVIGVVTIDDPYYTLSYSYLPEDATTNIVATSSSSDVTVLIDTISKEVLVNFSTEASVGQNVTIRITDTSTNNFDELTLIFKIPDVVVGD